VCVSVCVFCVVGQGILLVKFLASEGDAKARITEAREGVCGAGWVCAGLDGCVRGWMGVCGAGWVCAGLDGCVRGWME
jgi:hypothetical protein